MCASAGAQLHLIEPLGFPLVRPGDVFVFGPESRGLAPAFRETFPPGRRIRLPMRPDNRSLNLSNTVAIVVYEAWRQNGYQGGA
ncbi:tRNA (cytidine(34)-2'-O)-methyltransferase [Massilia oculi]|uniref:tRNA/rRNA methyltransferase SpoU type domain-containing protein n=1 Tax=Massilia oculi TaxID=945844 RepID=A0A2S2DGZ8_9BURK|nr:TrmH family RNA methyltransferase [Massilia oculi]AWL04617.1 hypothetical protein DIR46_09315 [Massilia oculi]